MHSNLVVAVLQLDQGQGVVKVLGICRVYGECQCLTEVLTALEILIGDLLRDLVGRILNFRGEPVRKTVLSEDSMHLCLVRARLSKHIGDISMRIWLLPVPAINDGSHLHTLLSSFRK